MALGKESGWREWRGEWSVLYMKFVQQRGHRIVTGGTRESGGHVKLEEKIRGQVWEPFQERVILGRREEEIRKKNCRWMTQHSKWRMESHLRQIESEGCPRGTKRPSILRLKI